MPIDSLADERDSARLRTRPDSSKPPPEPADAVGPPRNIERLPGWQRRIAAGIAVAALIGAAVYIYFQFRPTYLLCVVIEGIRVDAQVKIDDGLVQFVLKRALSQFPQLTVYGRGEFELARRLENKGPVPEREPSAARS